MANPIKSPKGIILIVGLVSFFIFENLAFAQTRVFVEEYTYRASEADSRLSSRVMALEQVKRILLEKLGTYLESETEVKNFQLTKDQIVILSAGIVRAEIVEERWDGKTYYLVSIRKPLILGERMFDRVTIRSKKIYGAANNSEISTQKFNPNAKA